MCWSDVERDLKSKGSSGFEMMGIWKVSVSEFRFWIIIWIGSWKLGLNGNSDIKWSGSRVEKCFLKQFMTYLVVIQILSWDRDRDLEGLF
jgi:hypothetical protein